MTIKCFLLEETEKIHTSYAEDGSWKCKQPIYKRADTGEEMILPDAPVGAIWRCTWYEDMDEYRGVDGKTYVVKTPGGDWVIDSRASNCTMPTDLVHKCWCRHGEAPNFTVDKIGNTCAAGAGSIAIGGYHGFLRDGILIDA